MRNIFKTFKENKKLTEENRLLKAQNDALTEFRKNFDKYYNDFSGTKLITRTRDNVLKIRAGVSLSRENAYCPTDVCKDRIVRELAKQLLPLIEYDVVDNEAYGTKDIVGTLSVVVK